MSDEGHSADDVRLDVWLDIACLFRTRSEAQRACKSGKIEVNGQSVKPHRAVQPGDEVRITRPYGRLQRIVVKSVAARHLPKADARLLYDDVTPPPTAEEINMRRQERMYRATISPHAPDKRARQALRKLKGKS